MTEKLNEAGKAPREVFAAGDVIFQEGDGQGDVYIIVSGQVQILKHNKDTGEDMPLAVLGPDSVFGDMSLINKQPRSATVKALEETTCIVISTQIFQEKLESLDPFMQSIYQILSGRLNQMNNAMTKAS